MVRLCLRRVVTGDAGKDFRTKAHYDKLRCRDIERVRKGEDEDDFLHLRLGSRIVKKKDASKAAIFSHLG